MCTRIANYDYQLIDCVPAVMESLGICFSSHKQQHHHAYSIYPARMRKGYLPAHGTILCIRKGHQQPAGGMHTNSSL